MSDRRNTTNRPTEDLQVEQVQPEALKGGILMTDIMVTSVKSPRRPEQGYAGTFADLIISS